MGTRGSASPGPSSGSGHDESTERGRQRVREEESYLPVIIKRSDEVRRHPDDVLTVAINEGLEQLDRPAVSLALSALAGGLILGFTAMAVAVMSVAVEPVAHPMLQRLATALVYPLGFVLCLMSGTELYTEHTATAVYPVLDRKASFTALVRLWFVVIAGNLAGALASAGLLVLADPVVGAREGYLAIGAHLIEPGAGALLVSAVLAGWLMALGAWLILATPPTASQIYMLYAVTFLIGLGGLHHSIAGAVEMFAALLAGADTSIGQAARFIGLALFGNLLGGSVFVALLNYGHIRKSQSSSDSSKGRRQASGGRLQTTRPPATTVSTRGTPKR